MVRLLVVTLQLAIEPLYNCKFADIDNQEQIWSEGGDKLKILNFESDLYQLFEIE